MEPAEVKELILRELPRLIDEDPDLQRAALRLASRRFADRAETESRFDRLLDELRCDREEQSRKWDENQREIHALVQSVDALARKHDSTIGALGARWGLYAESSFRNALKGILEDSFGVEVYSHAEEVPAEPA